MAAMPLDTAALVLIAITLFAATVNGALGYGFSSLTVPVAVLFYANRVLNPALVLIEIVVNSYALFINRRGVPRVWRRTLPIIAGLVPGVVVGSFLLSTVNPGVIWSGKYFQMGAEAVIPINSRTGNDVGFIVQLHFYLDDLFPHSLGRPLFGEKK